MIRTVLVTGGAGFIGAHVGVELLSRGYRVRAFDNLISQVHGPGRQRPAYMHRDVELIPGDIRDSNSVEHALADVDAVIHLASLVGVGQSMYEIGEYTSVNNLGTATLLQILSKKPVKSVVVASSMSIYGDGAYSDSDGNPCLPAERTLEQLRDWRLGTA